MNELDTVKKLLAKREKELTDLKRYMRAVLLKNQDYRKAINSLGELLSKVK